MQRHEEAFDANVGSAPDGLFSQASGRTYGYFEDRHGRSWGCDIEIKTGAPCGPMSIMTRSKTRPEEPVVVHPPLVPPAKYLRVDVRRRKLHINYTGWIEDALVAQEEYRQFMEDQATKMFGEMAHEAIEKRNPALLRRVGPAPDAVEQIEAAQAGHPWVLGFDPEKPSWAEQYWPSPRTASRTHFPTAAEERAQSTATATAVVGEFPKHRGGGKWELSDGSLTAGQTTKKDAQAAEAALHAPHESWAA